MDISDIRWNEPARQKILDDADGVLREAVIAIARESGVELLVCQSGLALTGLSMAELPAGTTAGGLVSLLATLGEDRLLAF